MGPDEVGCLSLVGPLLPLGLPLTQGPRGPGGRRLPNIGVKDTYGKLFYVIGSVSDILWPSSLAVGKSSLSHQVYF